MQAAARRARQQARIVRSMKSSRVSNLLNAILEGCVDVNALRQHVLFYQHDYTNKNPVMLCK